MINDIFNEYRPLMQTDDKCIKTRLLDLPDRKILILIL